MATAISSQEHAAPVIDVDSDYGSDLDDATMSGLIAQAESQTTPIPTIAFESIEAPAIIDDHGDSNPLARLGRIRENLSKAITGIESTCRTLSSQQSAREASVEIEYDEGNRTSFSRESPRIASL